MLRLYLYARVRNSSHLLHARPRVQQAPGIPCALLSLGETICNGPGETRRGNAEACVDAGRISQEGFQCIRLDAGGMLPVMSEPSSDVRQAATPKNAVSIKVATIRIIPENWLTPWPRNRTRCSEIEHGPPSRKMQRG